MTNKKDFDFKPIGARIKAVRTELGMTVAEVSKQVGYSTGSVSSVENGRKSPSLDYLDALFKRRVTGTKPRGLESLSRKGPRRTHVPRPRRAAGGI